MSCPLNPILDNTSCRTRWVTAGSTNQHSTEQTANRCRHKMENGSTTGQENTNFLPIDYTCPGLLQKQGIFFHFTPTLTVLQTWKFHLMLDFLRLWRAPGRRMYVGGAAELTLQYLKSILDIMLMLQAVEQARLFFFPSPTLTSPSCFVKGSTAWNVNFTMNASPPRSSLVRHVQLIPPMDASS